ALFHHRVSGTTDAGVGEKILDVAQTARSFVEQIFRIAVAINTAGHADIVPIDIQLRRAIREGERDFGEAERFSVVGAVENYVGHFAAAERLGGLFAEHPADRVEQIGFAASVRADDRGHTLVKIEERFIGKRFKAEELERL